MDDAIVPFTLDGSAEVDRLRSRTITIPYDWIEGDPYLIGITSGSGIQTVHEVPAAVSAPDRDGGAVLGYAVLGLLVGVLPVGLGLAWLPSLRRARKEWIAAFLALTAGLLVFVAVDAFAEALELQAALPAPLQGAGLILLGGTISFLGLAWLSQRLAQRAGGTLVGEDLSWMVALGIGAHNFGEGLAIGSSFALGELALGTFLVVGSMIHNVTEGLGIAAPIAAAGGRPSPLRLAGMALVAGLPAVVGGWVGGFLTTDLLGVLFLGIAVGAALQVVAEVAREAARRAPGGLASGYVAGGFCAGVGIMWLTSLIAG